MSAIIGINGENVAFDAMYMGTAGVNEGWNLSGGAALNIYCQPTLPTDKFDGIAILTPEKHSVKRIVSRETSFAIGGTWDNIKFIDSLGRAENDKSVFTYGTKMVLFYTNYSRDNNVDLVIFDYTTNTISILYQWTNYNPRCGKPMFKFDNVTHILYMRFIVPQISSTYAWQEATVNFDTNTFTLGAKGASQSSDPWTLDSTYVGFAGIDSDGNAYWVSQAYSSTGRFSVVKANYDTNTFSYVCTYSYPSSVTSVSQAPPCAIYDKVVYLCGTRTTDGLHGPFYAVNIMTKQITELPYPGEIIGGRTIACATSGKVFFLSTSNTSTLLIYDIGTNTWSHTPAASYYIGQRVIAAFNDRVLVPYAGWGGSSNTYHITSEKLNSNTLALTNGRSYAVDLIKTADINAIRLWFANVWWYDTNFKEYPTYIGNGTTWSKIKN